jgi:predicted RNA-binding protein YlqC (UPF0109 family)
VDDPAVLERLPAVVRADRAPEPLSPRPAAPRRERHERRAPGAEDEKLRDLIVLMARGLVDRPDDVAVDILEPGEDAVFELRVHPDDLGHVIGKQGRTARSMRLSLSAAAARAGRNANLEIAD